MNDNDPKAVDAEHLRASARQVRVLAADCVDPMTADRLRLIADELERWATQAIARR